jgi:hypothetical protein
MVTVTPEHVVHELIRVKMGREGRVKTKWDPSHTLKDGDRKEECL